MSISVVVCTRNRAELIGDCLKGLMANRCDGLEILVVDQSNDSATAEIVAAVAGGDPRIRYIRSDTVGLSCARNIGMLQSVGDIVAFTDDDCIPGSGWTGAIVEEFSRDGELCAVYGRSLPNENVPAGERPVAVKTDDKRRVFSRRCNPWLLGHGNNMAFRRQVFDKVGCFDETLGPGGMLRNCDDADFTYRVLRAGLKAVYSPVPVVYHKQFRRGEERWRLEKDYGIGAGALYLKHMKCGDLYSVRMLLDRCSIGGALHICYGLVTGRRAHLRLGWYRIAYALMGMWAARKMKVDVSHRIFVNPGSGG